MDKSNYIGKDVQGELCFQSIDANTGLIKGFNGYYVSTLVDGTDVLIQSYWSHEVKLDLGGHVYQTGMHPAPTIDLPDDVVDLYECETVSCDVCGAQHNSDDATGYSSHPTWTIVNECEAICLGCRNAEDTLILLESPKDLFKAKNLDDIDLTGYTKVETLFCDSSGMGSSGERALTKSQAEAEISKILSKSKVKLYAGITGIGQFQVYVSIFKKTRTKRVNAA